jgi:hypothetical protein
MTQMAKKAGASVLQVNRYDHANSGVLTLSDLNRGVPLKSDPTHQPKPTLQGDIGIFTKAVTKEFM